uniref:peptidylprolyl isomerase n=1 Tax=Skeletonema marinoi TaxID=267567 RepID=A0A6U3WNG8_9STRA
MVITEEDVKELPLSSIMITKAFIFATLTLSSSSSVVSGFAPSRTPAQSRLTTSSLHLRQSDKTNEISPSSISRATFLTTTLTSSAALWINSAQPSNALVKGNAPPPKKSASSEERKCRNVEECQEQAERAEEIKAQQEAEKAAANPPKVTSRGTNYLDIVEEGSTTSSSDKVARDGDTVEVHYKVLKLGKRSYDGLSGEGTVVFSRGYALEDDEKVIGDHSFKFTLGDNQVISALNDAVPGMAVGALRRISVTPQNGWEKNTKACDGGPGGSGAGGSLKTDYVVVPTATMVEQEACFDKNKLPFPLTYAQERRMAQRFDQSLIIEVRLVNVV